jgi:hypothetical protein
MKKLIASLSGATCLLLSASAHAIPYKVDFTASGYGPGIFGGAAAPQNSVTGTIFFTADAIGANISAIDAVDLTINGHAYTAEELGVSRYSDGYTFGAKVNGVGVTRTNSDDFYLILSSSFNVFAYAVASTPDTWTTRNITYTYSELVALPPASVPEPGILGLLGLGAAGFVLSRRRRA